MSCEQDRRTLDRGRSPPPLNTRDPQLLKSRVFIGNLPTDMMVRSDLEEMFTGHGKIIACSLHKGFGFVQYANESDARKSVSAVSGRSFKGYKLDVKMAAEGRKDIGKRPSPPPRGGSVDERVILGRDRSPLGDRRDPYRYENRLRRPPADDRRFPPEERDPYDRDPYRRDPYLDYPPPDYSHTEKQVFDCTIIAVTKQQRHYCEMVERRLKAAGLSIDMIILTNENALSQAMEDIQRDKTPYAIICANQNESHRSLTVNILHGISQEHRNMPLDDAIALIARNFEKYLEDMRTKPATPVGTGGRAPPVEFVPPDQHLAYLLNLLSDGRQVTLEEMEQIFTYINTRRNRLLEARGLPTEEKKPVSANAASLQQKSMIEQQAQLQAKILTILQGSGGMGNAATFTPPVSAPVPQSRPSPKPAPGGGPGLNFDSPSVQRALDNLIQSGPNLLRNINQGGASNASSEGSGRQREGAYGGFSDQANVGYGQSYRY